MFNFIYFKPLHEVATLRLHDEYEHREVISIYMLTHNSLGHEKSKTIFCGNNFNNLGDCRNTRSYLTLSDCSGTRTHNNLVC